jgi:hypothetical protein
MLSGLLGLAVLVPTLAGYVPNEALTAWQLTNAAYCSSNEIQAWSCPNCKKSGLALTEVTVTNTGGAQCFTAYNKASNQIVGSFRGSTDIANWIDNIDTVKTSYPYCSGCNVHAGFYKAYLLLVSGFRASMKNLKTKYPSASVRIYGHSLGGAEAVHAAADIHVNLGITPEFVYTFGQPRVGDTAFHSWYGSVIPHHYRVTHGHDIVPHVPPANLGFHHTALEEFYAADPPNYKECNGSGEDPSCSDQYLADLSIHDHLTYMGGTCCCTGSQTLDKPVEPSFVPLPAVNETTKSLCDAVPSCEKCIATNSLGVPACAWCTYQMACHDVGSIYNPCPPTGCVSRSPVSTCKLHNCSTLEIF